MGVAGINTVAFMRYILIQQQYVKGVGESMQLIELLTPEEYPKWPGTDSARYYIDVRNELREQILQAIKELDIELETLQEHVERLTNE